MLTVVMMSLHAVMMLAPLFKPEHMDKWLVSSVKEHKKCLLSDASFYKSGQWAIINIRRPKLM